MKGSAQKKVFKGKLLAIDVEYGDVLKKVEISGDFFVHPEEGINEIEQFLINKDVKTINTEGFKMLMYDFVEDKEIKLIGFTISDLIEVLYEVIT